MRPIKQAEVGRSSPAERDDLLLVEAVRTRSCDFDRSLGRFDPACLLEELAPFVRIVTRRASMRCGLPPSHNEDVAQDVLLRAWQTLQSGRTFDRAHFSIWIRTVAHHVAVDVARREARREGVELRVSATALLEDLARARDATMTRVRSHLAVLADDPGSCAVAQEMSSVVAEAIAQLPQRQRDALLRSVFEGESLAAIAARHGVSVASTHRDVLAALHHLRALMRWLDPPPSNGHEKP